MSEFKERNVKVLIIDSGVDLNHDVFLNIKIHGCRAFINERDEIAFDDNFLDDFGHGTAIFDIIRRNAPNAEIYNIKMFDYRGNADQKDIIMLLEFIYENIPCDIINLSLGITQYANLNNFENIVNKLHDKGVIIVSAFSNDGSVSFPAAFENVIGVESSKDIRLKNDFEFVEDSIINIRAKGGKQRVLWKMPEKYAIVEGNSFSAGYITASIANLMMEQKLNTISALEKLKKNAVKIYRKQHETNEDIVYKQPIKAVAFPFNKEIHSLIRYHNELPFSLEVCDIKASGKIGKSTGEYVQGTNFTIKNIDNLDWSLDFDTFILGHLEEILKLISKNYIDEIISNCIKYKKNLYALDNLEKYNIQKNFELNGLNLFYPTLGKKDVPSNSFGKLYFIPQPIVAVCGTSSQQGKFTLQLLLRKLLTKEGYKVGQLGTEPSSLLYGMDKVCSYGYGYDMVLSEYPFISAVNKMLYDISKKDPDIIICGTQSGTIPYSYDNLNVIPLHSIEFLMGVKPDAVILCINYHDEINYIKRTINTIENLLETKVIALCLFPLTIEYNWQGILLGSKRPLSEEEIDSFKRKVKENTNKDVYLLLQLEDMDNLKNGIIDFFEE